MRSAVVAIGSALKGTRDVVIQCLCGICRGLGLACITAGAVIDVLWMRLVTHPSGTALAHMRAQWLHRWSRIARTVLGLGAEERGHAPVSGIVVANRTSMLDAILLAACRPCIFVAGRQIAEWPIVGTLARLAGTIFVDLGDRADVLRVNFMIQRTLERRLLVVLFPECGASSDQAIGAFASALFQPAAVLGCTVTAAVLAYHFARRIPGAKAALGRQSGFLAHLGQVITRWRTHATIAFSGPKFRTGNRKQLARQLHNELLALQFTSDRLT